jgi:hypothetical protein
VQARVTRFIDLMNLSADRIFIYIFGPLIFFN